jgi:hypothetical protein
MQAGGGWAGGRAGGQTGDRAESEGVGAAHLVPATGRALRLLRRWAWARAPKVAAS